MALASQARRVAQASHSGIGLEIPSHGQTVEIDQLPKLTGIAGFALTGRVASHTRRLTGLALVLSEVVVETIEARVVAELLSGVKDVQRTLAVEVSHRPESILEVEVEIVIQVV